MDAKKTFAIFACAAAAVLGGSFAIFPFCEHKINWDVVAAKAAAKAADAGCEDIAADIAGRIKYKQFAGAANAHIALLKCRKSGAQKADAFIKSCGKHFDFDEYNARLMIEEIAAEPDFAPGFFKLKYLPRIEALKNPYLKAVLYYKLSLRTKNAGSKKYAALAFSILKAQPGSESKTRACVEISEMALANDNPEDFFEIIKICPVNAHCYAALFRFLTDEKFCKYIKNKKERLGARNALAFCRELKKRDFLEAGNPLKYAALNLDYNWRTNNYRDFNMPLFAYISFVINDEEAFKFYKHRALSDENIKVTQGSQIGYLNSAAIFFCAMGDYNSALKILERAKYSDQKLRMRNSMVLALPINKRTIEVFVITLVQQNNLLCN